MALARAMGPMVMGSGDAPAALPRFGRNTREAQARDPASVASTGEKVTELPRLPREDAGGFQASSWPWVKIQIVPPENIPIPLK